jgi:hypothetical protein
MLTRFSRSFLLAVFALVRTIESARAHSLTTTFSSYFLLLFYFTPHLALMSILGLEISLESAVSRRTCT